MSSEIQMWVTLIQTLLWRHGLCARWHTDCRWRFNGLTGQCTMLYSNIPSLPPSKSYIPICYIPIFLQVHYKSPNCCPISWARKIRRIFSPNCQHTHRPVNTKWELALTNWNHFLFNLILVFVFVFVSPDRLEPLDHIALGFVSEALQVNLDQVGTVIAHFQPPPCVPLAHFAKF